MSTNRTKQAILSATLKAEAERIRYLKGKAQRHLRVARELRIERDPDVAAEVVENEAARLRAYADQGGANHLPLPFEEQVITAENYAKMLRSHVPISDQMLLVMGEWINQHMTHYAALRDAAVCPSQRARCANLALGFLRGREYVQIENKTKTHKPKMFQLAREVAMKAGVRFDDIVKWIDATWPNEVKDEEEQKAA